MHHEVVIVGGGAAGLNAALLLGRARRSVVVCDDGRPRNRVAERTHGFLSRDGCPPARLIRRARADAGRYPSVTFAKGTVTAASAAGSGFVVHLDDGGRLTGDRLLLANGVNDMLPSIEGLARFWGRSIFVCPFCDGWEVRDRRLVVASNDVKSAIHLAQELHQWSPNVTICAETNGALPSQHEQWLRNTQCILVDSRVVTARGSGRRLEAVELADGRTVSCDALFIAGSLRQSCSVAASLGCKVGDDGMLVVDDDNQTTVRGCYAAGDAVTAVHQLVVAAASGVRAAIAISADLVEKEVAAATGTSVTAGTTA